MAEKGSHEIHLTVVSKPCRGVGTNYNTNIDDAIISDDGTAAAAHKSESLSLVLLLLLLLLLLELLLLS